MVQVRNEVQAMLNQFEKQTKGNELAEQFQKVRQPLIFFVDNVIVNSNLSFAAEWQRLSHETAEFAGDEKFFDLLDAELAASDAENEQRLAIFYTCLGLGFQGKFQDDRAQLDAYMAKIAAQIRGLMDIDEAIKICPEAYHHTIRRPLAEPVGRSLVGIGVVAAILVAIAFALNGAIYFTWSNELRSALNKFNASFAPAASVK